MVRFELTTSVLSGQHSNQLSYIPLVPLAVIEAAHNRLDVSYKKNSYEGESYQCGFSTPI